MGNTIDWGQAAVNNTIGFGDGAENNTIGWGDIQADSWSPETNLTGTGGTPAWTNTLSTTFDGVDDYVDSNFIIPAISTYTFSLWFKMNGVPSIHRNLIGDMNSSGQSASGRAVLGVRSSTGKLFVGMGDNSSFWYDLSSYDLSPYLDNAWHNIILSVNGTTLIVYIDGLLAHTYTSTVSAGTIGARTYRIGNGLESLSNGWLGNLDEVSIFSSELSASDVTDIYNLGTPTDLSLLATPPLHWYRMGDGSTYPTINDLGSGSNDGTMNNMSSANFVADVPT
mgnify:CR=1 FL=1